MKNTSPSSCGQEDKAVVLLIFNLILHNINAT